MAMTEGYTQYVCDRCGAVLYAQQERDFIAFMKSAKQ